MKKSYRLRRFPDLSGPSLGTSSGMLASPAQLPNSDTSSDRAMLVECLSVLEEYLTAIHPANQRIASQKARDMIAKGKRYLA